MTDRFKENYSIHYLLLALSERQILQLGTPEATPLCQLHEIGGGVGAGTQNKDDRRERSTLFEDRLEADDWRHDILLTHDLGDVVGDRAVDSIDAEATQQHEVLEVIRDL